LDKNLALTKTTKGNVGPVFLNINLNSEMHNAQVSDLTSIASAKVFANEVPD